MVRIYQPLWYCWLSAIDSRDTSSNGIICCLLYFFLPITIFPYTSISLNKKNWRDFGRLRHILLRRPRLRAHDQGWQAARQSSRSNSPRRQCVVYLAPSWQDDQPFCCCWYCYYCCACCSESCAQLRFQTFITVIYRHCSVAICCLRISTVTEALFFLVVVFVINAAPTLLLFLLVTLLFFRLVLL